MKRIYGWFRNEAERLRIVARWLPVIWRDADFDHGFLWRVWEHKFRRMAAHFEEHTMVANWSNQVRELRIAAELCRRLGDDDYIFTRGFDGHPWDVIEPGWEAAEPFGHDANYTEDAMKFRHEGSRRDLDYLCRLIRRKAQTWWD